MKLGFFIKEAMRALGRNAMPSVAAAATVLITTLVLGVFIPVVQSATGKTNELREKIELEVLLQKDTTRAEASKLERKILTVPHVRSVRYRSKVQNLESLDLDQETAAQMRENILPPSLAIRLDDPKFAGSVKEQLEPPAKRTGRKPFSPEISEVADRKEEREKIVSVTSTIKFLLGFLTMVLVGASILLVSNTIRLSVYARRREVEVMRLVGATGWFIRWPFVLEGLLVGALGGVGAVALLLLAKKTIIDPLSDSFAIIAAPETISFALLAIVLLGLAMLVSALGCGLTLRRFLRV